MKKFALVLHYLVLGLTLASLSSFIQLMNPVGFLMAVVTAIIIWGLWKKQRWGYFALAALGLACFQLAKQDLALTEVKRLAMTLGFCVIPVAIFLHEMLASPKKPSENHPSEE